MRKVEDAIISYLRSRNNLLSIALRYPHLLSGNDNVIGRIGEYLAITFLKRKGRIVSKVLSKSQKGHDLLDGNTKISVKILTTENVRGRGLRLTEPWDELVLIVFDTDTLDYRVGHLTKPQFQQARRENPGWGTLPHVKTTMLGPKGLIGKYGVVSVASLRSSHAPFTAAERRKRRSLSSRLSHVNN